MMASEKITPNVSVVPAEGAKKTRVEKFTQSYMTVEELLDPKFAEGLTDEAMHEYMKKKKENKNLDGTNLIAIPTPAVPPSLKELGKKWTEGEIKAFFSVLEKYGIIPAPSVQRDARDPHFKKSAGPENLMTYHQTFTSIGKDGDLFNSIAQLPLTHFTVDQINDCRRSLALANEWIVTNAPFVGLMKRVQAGLSRPKPPFKVEDYVQDVFELFPIAQERLRNLSGQSFLDVCKFLRIDVRTGSGAPFFRPKAGVLSDGKKYNDMPAICEISAEILDHISRGKIDEWIKHHPSLTVALLRNKLDKYELKEVKEKIRPYYTFPACWNMLWSAIFQSVADASVLFLDDEKSINAHGFSWSKGGAQKLYEWIRTRKPGFHAVAYSDDMIWVFVTKDGKIYVLTPDFKMMDMSLGIRFGALTYAWLLKVFGDKLDKTWAAVAELGCRMAFKKYVLVAYALCYVIQGGLASGVAGTPEYDQVASCAYIGRAKRKYFNEVFETREQIEEAVRKCAAEQQRILGLELKQETLAVHEFVPGEDYPWLVFLGHALRKCTMNGKTFYVPVRPFDKVVLSLVSPKGSYSQNGLARIRAAMQRAIGITASGGWFYPELFFAAGRYYNVHGSRGVTPADENDMTFMEYTAKPDSSVEVPRWSNTRFPDRTWFINLVAPHVVVEEATPAAGPVSREKVDMKALWGLGGNWDEGDWADAEDSPMAKAELKDRLPSNDRGAANVQAVSRVDPKLQGRVEPLPDSVKKAYRDQFALARAARRNMYLNGTAVVRKVEKGSKMERYLATLDEEWNTYFDEKGAEELIDEDDASNVSIPDEVLDDLHAARITPSMVRGWYGDN